MTDSKPGQEPAPFSAFFGCDDDEAEAIDAATARDGRPCRVERRPLTAEAAGSLGGACVVSVSHLDTVDEAVLAALAGAGVRHLLTRSVGLDHIDLAAARRVGVSVENVTYDPDAVADYTVMLMLMGIRHARATLSAMERQHLGVRGQRGRDLRSLTVSIVGHGRIGTAVAERLRGFGCRIITVGRRASDATETDLDRALRRSDVVTLHLPNTPANRHTLSADRIGLLRPEALVVNTGRGELIDSAALLDALERGRIAGAALDVVEGEREAYGADARITPVIERLARHPRVILTPHVAYFTTQTLHQILETTLRRCREIERSILHA